MAPKNWLRESRSNLVRDKCRKHLSGCSEKI
ncbi:MAG: DUF1187 family protein [Rivularia sp. (in: cyanobacteria)]